ncbi:MAG: PaaI family thioesterase [Chlorobi bacterium]|nr:PaaI family thioesterase [Chlorobiota bacterium]
MPKEIPEELRRFLLKRIKDSNFVTHLGIDTVEYEVGRVLLKLPVKDFMVNPYGVLHGGVLSTLVDTAMGFSAFTTIKLPEMVAAGELNINFLRPGKGSKILYSEGKVYKRGKRLIFCEGMVWDDVSEEPIIRATSIMVVFKPTRGSE